jgi:hypothetical protein
MSFSVRKCPHTARQAERPQVELSGRSKNEGLKHINQHYNNFIRDARDEARAKYDGTFSDCPSREIAMEYVKQVLMPKRVVLEAEDEESARIVRMAQPGERVEAPYRLDTWAWDTPLEELQCFGIGISMYLYNLKWLSICALIIAAGHAPIILHFMGDNYSRGQPGVNILVKGTAVCTDKKMVYLNGGNETLLFHNRCELSFQQGLIDIMCTVFLVIFLHSLVLLQNRQIQQAHQAVQTVQDYSVEVVNPAVDADNSDEWMRYFSKWGRVVNVTIARQNGKLIRTLAKRLRVKADLADFDGLKKAQGDKTEWGTRKKVAERSIVTIFPREVQDILQTLGIFATREQLTSRAIKTLLKVTSLMTGKYYPVVRVYVTFDTEKAQRSCLRDLWLGGIEESMDRNGLHSSVRSLVRKLSMGDALKEQMAQLREEHHKKQQNSGRTKGTPPAVNRTQDYQHLLFLGEEDGMINVREAPDPSNISWEHLGLVSWATAISQQLYVLFCIGGTLLFTYELVDETQKLCPPIVTGLAIVVINCVTRPVLRHLCSRLEKHESCDAKESSIFWKLSLSSCLNSAFVIWWLTPSDEVLSAHRMQLILWVSIIDAVVPPVLSYLEPIQAFKRGVLAPSAITQRAMNSLFTGACISFPEIYAGYTATIFMPLFFMALTPTCVLFTAISLWGRYLVHKVPLTIHMYLVHKVPLTIHMYLVHKVRRFIR